jgi:NAD(P)H-hydrate epimerase
MERVLTNAQMRASDAYTIQMLGVSSEILMERAGLAIAEEVAKSAKALQLKNILVVCGSGNNGGDGYVCARALLKDGWKVAVFDCGGKYSADCLREKERYGGKYVATIAGDLIVDCLFGTGLSREVTGANATIIGQINQSGAYVVAADIPSGLNGDNGQVMGVAVKANKTVAIAEYKLGMLLGDGREYCGEVIKRDIGITVNDGTYAQMNTQNDIKKFFPPRPQNSHKGTFGVANLVVASEQYAGVAFLSAGGALRSGCGYVRLTLPERGHLAVAVASVYPQVIVDQTAYMAAQAMIIGSGCGCTQSLYDSIKMLLKTYTGKLIIDADGLNVLAKYGVDCLAEKSCEVLLTPHIKEFSRLTGLSTQEILQNPVENATMFAKKYGVTVLLKSAVSVITDGTRVMLNVRGNSALAKAGSGDMLGGFVCGTAARGLSLFDSAVCGAYVMGMAAEITAEQTTEYAATAKEILENIPTAIKQLTKTN